MRARPAVSLLAAAALVAVLAAPVAAAKPSSAYAPPVVQWVQPTVHANADGTASVHVHYTCSGGNAGTHLFIGVKQGPEVNATDHTSSQFANTFYSTNWNSDGPGLSLNCNGRQQNATFVVKPDRVLLERRQRAAAVGRDGLHPGLRVRQHQHRRDGSQRLRLRLLDAQGRRRLTFRCPDARSASRRAGVPMPGRRR